MMVPLLQSQQNLPRIRTLACPSIFPGNETRKYIELDGVGPILIERSRKARRMVISIRIEDRRIRVAVPRGVAFKQAEQFAHSRIKWIRRQLEALDRKEQNAKNIRHQGVDLDDPAVARKLYERLRQLALQHGFTCNRVSFRYQKTRWGSCSVKNNISLNMKLALLPDELADYVILHELVHTRIKNHSPAFWDELGKYVDQPRHKASKLKEYGPALI